MSEPSKSRRLLRAALITLCAAACQRASGGTSGETHFLTLCVPQFSSAACGDELSCYCNTCTLPCDSDADCSGLPGARCVDAAGVDACSGAPVAAICAMTCEVDADCAELGDRRSCVDGACLFEQDMPPEPQTCALRNVDANEVLMIGDSFFALSHEITGFLEERARNAGVLSGGERFRDRSSTSDNALARLGNGIEAQFTQAVSESAVSVVIMNGGGADALLGSCETIDADCPPLVEAASAAERLFALMSEEGVEDVIYAFYPEAVEDTPREMADALRPVIRGHCEAATVRCHWLDLRPTFEGNYEQYILPDDGLYPTTEGSEATADAIWAVLVDNCIGE